MKNIALSFLLIFLAGCSSKPSTSEIQSQVEKVILSEGRDKIFSVGDFEKVNGFSVSDNVYTADIKYNLVFKVGLSELQDNIRREAGNNDIGELGAVVGGAAMLFTFGNFKAGDKVPRQEKVEFIKTDNGWMISDSYRPP